MDQARAKPEVLHYSSSGIGSMSHMAMELLCNETGVKMRHVPYRGTSLAVPDLLSGRLHATVGTLATYSGLIASGKLRALAVTSAQRSPVLPNVPTTAEAGLPSYTIDYQFGLVGPTGIPADIIRRLNTELNSVAMEADTREVLARLAAIPSTGTPEEFGNSNTFEVARWSKLIRDANIKVE